MSSSFLIPKARCAALVEIQRRRQKQQSVSRLEVADYLTRKTGISSKDADRISGEVMATLSPPSNTPALQGPFPCGAPEPFPRVIKRFGEEWRLQDQTATVALYDCFNPSGTHRGQVVMEKRWQRREKTLPSGKVQRAGTPILPSAEEFGQFAWNFHGTSAGRRRFDEMNAR